MQLIGHVKIHGHIMRFYNIVTNSPLCLFIGCRKFVEPTVVSHSYGSDEFNMMFFTQVS